MWTWVQVRYVDSSTPIPSATATHKMNALNSNAYRYAHKTHIQKEEEYGGPV